MTYELLGFIQGDGTLTDLNNPSKKGITIDIGKDDGDINEYFNLNKKVGERKVYYNKNPKLIALLYSLKFDLKVLPERQLPFTFDNWKYEDKINFIRGLYSANGSILVKAKRITFKSTSIVLINQLNDFWHSLGINSYITTNKSKSVKFANGDYICKESYDLNICRVVGRIWFRDNIGFLQHYKNDKVNESISSTKIK